MNTHCVANTAFASHFAGTSETPTLGQQVLQVLRYVFDQPERQKKRDFVWSYEELADHIPD